MIRGLGRKPAPRLAAELDDAELGRACRQLTGRGTARTLAAPIIERLLGNTGRDWDRRAHRLATLAAGLVWLSLLRPDGGFTVDVLPATLVTAAGMAMAFIPSLGLALSSAAPEEGGLAAGIVNTSYQVGSALGLAAMTAVAAAFGADRVGDLVALTDGFSAGLLGAAGIAAIGAIAAAAWLRTPTPVAEAPAEHEVASA